MSPVAMSATVPFNGPQFQELLEQLRAAPTAPGEKTNRSHLLDMEGSLSRSLCCRFSFGAGRRCGAGA